MRIGLLVVLGVLVSFVAASELHENSMFDNINKQVGKMVEAVKQDLPSKRHVQPTAPPFVDDRYEAKRFAHLPKKVPNRPHKAKLDRLDEDNGRDDDSDEDDTLRFGKMLNEGVHTERNHHPAAAQLHRVQDGHLGRERAHGHQKHKNLRWPNNFPRGGFGGPPHWGM